MSEKRTIELEVPLTNVGRHPGGVYDGQKNQTVFSGKVQVDPQTAEDLMRREKEYNKYRQSLIDNNGHTDMEVDRIVGGGN